MANDEIYGPGQNDYGRDEPKKLVSGGCVKSDTPAEPLDLTQFNVPTVATPNATPTPNLTGPLITDHVFSQTLYQTVGPFSVCAYCQGHYAKHLYQSSAVLYQYTPYSPPTYPWYQWQTFDVPAYPYPVTVTYNVSNQTGSTGNTDGRQTTSTARQGPSIST